MNTLRITRRIRREDKSKIMIGDKKHQEEKKENVSKEKPGAGIVNEEVRKENELIHKGRPGEIDDEEDENTDLKGFDKTALN
jgi:hypothetical protein